MNWACEICRRRTRTGLCEPVWGIGAHDSRVTRRRWSVLKAHSDLLATGQGGQLRRPGWRNRWVGLGCAVVLRGGTAWAGGIGLAELRWVLASVLGGSASGGTGGLGSDVARHRQVSGAAAASSVRMTAIWRVPRRLGAAWYLPVRTNVDVCVRRAFVLLGKAERQRLGWRFCPGLTQFKPLGARATVERWLLNEAVIVVARLDDRWDQ